LIKEMIKVFNSLTQRKEEFKPDDPVKMYVCGVTTYSDCHIGHAMSYIIFDVIRRYLRLCACRQSGNDRHQEHDGQAEVSPDLPPHPCLDGHSCCLSSSLAVVCPRAPPDPKILDLRSLALSATERLLDSTSGGRPTCAGLRGSAGRAGRTR